jgi:tRNA A-37 threonylcarbamoyl transferase component Bud32
MANASRQAQEEMALDLKLLEEALSSTQYDDVNRAKKKVILF